MKIVHLSTYDEIGGAARAASRLHRGLLDSGVDSWMAVQRKFGDRKRVVECGNGKISKASALLRPYVDAFPLFFSAHKKGVPWNISWLPNRLGKIVDELSPDIVHAHWIGMGFLSLHNLKQLESKLVLSLHDSWPFTGGCNVIGECTAFKQNCGRCPQLGSACKYDLSFLGWHRKQRLYQKKPPVFVAPSRWMAEQARSSSLLADSRIEIIPNGLDTSVFRPVNKQTARVLLNLPIDKKIVAFGAMSATTDRNKGFEKLKNILSILNNSAIKDEFELVVFGASEPLKKPDLGCRVTYLGEFFDEISMAVVYSAVDVMCVPSLQESFGQVAVEAMSCGTPVVAFGTSGLLDIVEHGVSGYLAPQYNEIDFARNIELLLSDQARLNAMSQASRRRVVENFDISIVSEKFYGLYEDVLSA